ncbi:MAG: CARDB domain-containing protein [Planctomycetota bacterium]
MKQEYPGYAFVFCCAFYLLLSSYHAVCHAEEGAPDLIISGYGSFVEDNPWLRRRNIVAPGDSVVYSITITNQGDTAYEGQVRIQALNLPDGWQCEVSTAEVNLPPYSQEQVSDSLNVSITIPDDAKPGRYNVTFRIDPVEGETETYNNIHNVPVNILALLPDLNIVDVRWQPIEVSVFDRPEIEVVLRNQGTANSGPFKLEMDVQLGSETHTTHLEAEVPGMSQGETKTWKFEKIMGKGMFSPRYNRNVVMATVNSDRRFSEYNYTNNERQKYIVVKEGPLYVDPDWEPHDPTTEDEVDFILTITNEGNTQWILPDRLRNGRGSTIILRYWPVGDFDASKAVEDAIWSLAANKSRIYHLRTTIPQPGDYMVKCEIFAGFPYWIVAQTPQMTFTVSKP